MNNKEEVLNVNESNEQPVKPITGVPPVTNQIQNKKSSKKTVIVVTLIAIIIIGYIFHNKYLVDGKKIVKEEVKTLFTFANKTVDVFEKKGLDYDLEKESLGVESNLSFSSDYKNSDIDLTKLEKYSLNYGGVISKKDNKLSGNISLMKENKPLLSIEGYINGKEALIKSEQLFTNVFKTKLNEELKDIDTTKSLNYDNIRKLINKTEQITLNSINEQNITKTEEKININNKSQSVLKVSYDLNMKEYKKDILKGYLNDDEVLKILSELINKDQKETKKLLEEELDTIEKDNSNDSTSTTINVYVDKILGTFKEVEIISKEKSYYETTRSLVITKEKEVYNFTLKNDGDLILTGSYDSSKKVLNLEKKADDMKFKMVIKNEKENVHKMNLEYSQSNGASISIDAVLETELTKKSQKSDLTVSLNYKYDKESISGKIKNTLKITKGEVPKTIKADNAKDFSEMTQDEMIKAYDKLSEILQNIAKDVVPQSEKITSSEDVTDYFGITT